VLAIRRIYDLECDPEAPELEQFDSLCDQIRSLSEDVESPAFLQKLSEFCDYCNTSELHSLSSVWDCNILPILLSILSNRAFSKLALHCIGALTAYDDDVSEFLCQEDFCQLIAPLFCEPDCLSLLLSALANIAGSTDLCRESIIESIPVTNFCSLLPVVRSDERLSRSLARVLMSLAKSLLPPDLSWPLLDCFCVLSESQSRELVKLSFWGIHYLLNSSQELLPKLIELKIVDRMVAFLSEGDESMLLVLCHLIRDCMKIEYELLREFPWTLLSPALQHSNLEIIKVASLCLRELIVKETDSLDMIWELTEGRPFHTHFEVASTLFNLILTSPSQMCNDMVAAGIFRFFAKWSDFDSQELLSKMVKVLARLCLGDESGYLRQQAAEWGISEKVVEWKASCQNDFLQADFELLGSWIESEDDGSDYTASAPDW
jgi:hypothetical protein